MVIGIEGRKRALLARTALVVRYLLGIDIGTSAVKTAAFDRRGRRAGLASASCRVSHLQPGWVEHDPAQTWRSVVRSLRALWRQTAVDPAQVAAVGLSGHFSTVFLDEAGAPAAPCLTWLDSRATEEAQWLAAHLGPESLVRYQGIRLPLSAAMPPARVLWVARHCPHALARTAWTAQTKDYVGWRLHGRRLSDAHSMMGLRRVPDGRVFPAYLKALGLPPTLLPPLAPPWQIVGTVTGQASRAAGLPAGTPVVTGWIDSYCSMLGTGMGDPAMGFDVAGTSEVIGVVTERPVRARHHRGELVIPLDADITAVYGLTNAGADSLAWARETWGRGVSYGQLLKEAEAVTLDPGGPLFLPYLQGERSPVWDERAAGALVGLKRHHGRGHLVRAVLEGVAFSVRHNLENVLLISGRSVSGLRVSGGGALGDLWNQVKADVLGRPMHLVEEPEAGALGAAMLAARGLGWYHSFAEAVAGMVRVTRTWSPRPETRQVYDARYRRYLTLYPALEGALHG